MIGEKLLGLGCQGQVHLPQLFLVAAALHTRPHTRGAGPRRELNPDGHLIIDEQIRQARENGAFDNLRGTGKPLPDIDKPYDPDWWTKQLVRREQISMLPPALELLRKVETEMQAIWTLGHEAHVRRRLTALNAEIARANCTVAEGPPTTLAPLDVEAIVARWRSSRAGVEKSGA